jgi:hypothetical protein
MVLSHSMRAISVKSCTSSILMEKIKKVPRHRLAHIEFTVKQQKKHAEQAATKRFSP